MSSTSFIDRIRPVITHTPVAARTDRITTYSIKSGRADFDDVIAQFVVLMRQLHTERFRGSLRFNFNDGVPCTVETTERGK